MIPHLVDLTHPELIREFERSCPKFNAAISKRRYLLPRVRQGDYISQEFCDNHAKDLICQWAMGACKYDQSLAVETLNLTSGLHYDRPLLYLERELGEKLMQTELPEDFTTEEIYWPWPAFRVMLPQGLVASTAFDGKPISALYVDMSLLPEGSGMGLPVEFAKELYGMLGEATVGPVEDMCRSQVRLDMSGFFLSALTDYQMPGKQPDVCSCMANWKDWNLRLLVTQASKRKVLAGSDPREVNHELMERLRFIGLNLLLFLSQEPLSVFTDNWIRKPRKEGRHQVGGLLKARFVGDCMPKLRVNPPVAGGADHEPTGQHYAPHWVKGHWHRVVYGKKRALRRRQWMMPYRTGPRDQEAA